MESTTERDAAEVRVALIDDHEIARAGLRAMLGTEPGWRVVGEAVDGGGALDLCRRLDPDVVLMDVRMPHVDGIAATRAILEERPGARIVITTMYEDPDYLQRALEAGAVGYVLKDATRQELIGAIRQALRGEFPLHQPLASRVLRRLATDALRAREETTPHLTPRELDVLRLVVQGLTNRQIAERLSVSLGTVKLHMEHIIDKLDVTDRTQAAARAVELGLCSTTAGR